MHLLRTAIIALISLSPTGLCSAQNRVNQDARSSIKQVKHAAKSAASPSPVRDSLAQISYREEIEPILKANCGSCHSADKHMSGFVVETPEFLFKGGSKLSGKVIVPGKSGASGIIAYLRGRQQPRMPLNGNPLSEEKIKKLETWIAQGAKIDALKIGWPYTPVASQSIPHVKIASWIQSPIDNFILSKLESRGLKPSPPAPKIALLRRVFADLVGMSPTPLEAEAFLNDKSPDAYPKLIDRLLGDPRYGERWARHWLDLVRYAETHGFENDGMRPRAWRFRDYVIKSFNADKPYDRFLKEQIAGDELYPEDADALVATGYARLGAWDELSTEPQQRWQDYLNDVTDTTGSVMLGLTVGCARCHNHKYDRITQSDYYRFQAFFTGTQWTEKRLPETGNQDMAKKNRLLEAMKKQRNDLHEKYRAIILAERQQKAKRGDKISVSDRDIDKVLKSQDRQQRDRLENEIRSLTAEIAPFEPVAEVISDRGKTIGPTHLLLRGNLKTPGPEVLPGFIGSLSGGQETAAVCTPVEKLNSSGRRSALANLIASPANPMTARVIVNRLWQHHFGRGIVATPSDFGKNGDRVSHPELLDWLAARFDEDGWSLKKMHRLMLLSSTYQQSTKIDPQSSQADPNNALLWRMNRIRMEGEVLRDSILKVSGRLNPQMGGPSIYPHVSDEVLSTGSTHKWGNSPEDQGLRRTIYVFQRRSLVLPIVEAFDGADMSSTCPRRAATTIAPQALALFNGEFTRTESRYFAERVRKEAGDDPIKQIELAYRIALCRPPTASQKSLALEFIQKQKSQSSALAELCHVLINTNEFLYLD